MIFVSDNLNDLLNTKQFNKFRDKEYKKWKLLRDQASDIPLLPYEPVAFFDLGKETEIIVDVSISKPIRYVKFVPTAFRKSPINYSSKSFNSN